METIKLPAFFGSKSKKVLLTDIGYLKITLHAELLEFRQCYEYQQPVEEDVTITESRLINERSFFKRSAFHTIGIVYENECDCFSITLQGGENIEIWVKIETVERCNEVFDILKDWWVK